MFSRPDKFNDPFDCFPAGMKLKSERKLRLIMLRILSEYPEEARAECAKLGWKYEQVVNDIRSGRRSLDSHRKAILKSDGHGFQEYFAKEVAMISLSSQRDNLAMWSYYAEKHAGIVLGIKTRAFLPMPLYKVKYSRNRPRIGQHETDEDNIRKFTVKAPAWSHEREWRFTEMIDNIRLYRKFRSLASWSDERILWEIEPSNIECILLGIRCNDLELLNIVEHFHLANPLCPILKAERDCNKFKLNFTNWSL